MLAYTHPTHTRIAIITSTYRRTGSGTLEMSTPSMKMAPAEGSTMRNSAMARLLLPDPAEDM